MKKFLSLLLILVCVSFPLNVQAKEPDEEKVGTIYIGDSRTVQMNDIIHMDELPDTFVVAKSGMGYNWYMKTGSEKVYNIREKYKDNYDRWIYIFNLGVNDLSNIDNYVNLIEELSKEATLYYVSINPTVDAVKGIQCADIEKFNSKIISHTDNTNISYIDSYDYLYKVTGYNAPKDGMHYDTETYEKLYEFINLAVEVQEFIKKNNSYSAAFYLYNYR